MKMKFYLIMILVAALGISSCYDDKGNYDYKDLQRIEIEFPQGGIINKTLWDTLEITPRFTYSNPADTVMNLEYTWTFGNKVISKERNLKYIIDTIQKAPCCLKVEDKDNGVFFVQSTSLNVGNKYETGGYIVLSEKNGKSCLSFLPLELQWDENWEEVIGVSCTVTEDAYKRENHEELGTGPIKVHLHYCFDQMNLGGNQIMVVQQGDRQLVDVNSKTFLKEVTGDQIFAGGWPSGLKVADVMFMFWSDLIQDEQGRLYSRVKSTDQLFHSEYFLPDPLKYEGKVMENMRIIPGFVHDAKFCLLYDEKDKRFFVCIDLNGNKEQAVGKIIALKEELSETGTYPEKFVPLENLGDYNLVHVGYLSVQFGSSTEYFVVLEKDGKYYQQEFAIERDYSTSDVMIKDMNFLEISGGESVIDANSLIYALPNDYYGAYVLISKGNQLYLYDRNSPSNGIKPFYTFDGNITSMDSEIYRSRCLGVGLDNGKFALLKMINAKNLQTPEEKLFWQTPDDVNLGHIKDIRYK